MFNFADFGQLGAFENLGGSPVDAAYQQAQLLLDFVANTGRLNGVGGTAASKLTVARASVGYIDDMAGNWTQVAANLPRISDKGLLIEEPRTNSIRNNAMVGVVTGSPGTAPTNWQIPTSVAGITASIVGTGVQNGVDYIDVRWVGTSSVAGSPVIFFETVTGVPGVAPGQIWVPSCFVAMIGGSLANIFSGSCWHNIYEYDASQVFLRNNQQAFVPNSTFQRFNGTGYTIGATAAFARPGVFFTVASAGLAIDITLRIGWPQFEVSASSTSSSPLRTAGAAVARAADMVEVTSFVPTTPATLMGEIWHESLRPASFPGIAQIHGTSGDSDRMGLYYGGADIRPNMNITVGSTAQAAASQSAPPFFTPSRSICTIATNDFAFAANGSSVAVDNLGTVSSPIVKLAVGRLGSASNFASCYIRKIVLWNSRLSDALLTALSTVDIYDQARVFMDFTSDVARVNGAWTAARTQLTCVRASPAWMDTSDGWWGQISPNLPRISDKGLLVEAERTNCIRNNSMQGAVAGPIASSGLPLLAGRLPTNWKLWDNNASFGGDGTGMTTEVVAKGNDHGVDYVDIRVHGVSPVWSWWEIDFESTGAMPAAAAQTWTGSLFSALVAGQFPSDSPYIYFGVAASKIDGAWIEDIANIPPPTSSAMIRVGGTGTTTSVDTGMVMMYLYIEFIEGAVVDFTFRVGWPQVELGGDMTSPIRTTSGQVKREKELVNVKNVPAFYNQSASSLLAEWQMEIQLSVDTWGQMATFYEDVYNGWEWGLGDDQSAGGEIWSYTYLGSAGVHYLDMNHYPINLIGKHKNVMCVVANDGAAYLDGMMVNHGVPDNTAVQPTGITQLWLGNYDDGDIGAAMNGYLKRVVYWPARLTNAQMQALSTP